jgi:hypothetical protein
MFCADLFEADFLGMRKAPQIASSDLYGLQSHIPTKIRP